MKPNRANTRLHRPLVEGVVTALREIFSEGKYADKVISQLLKSNRKWGSRDRGFVAENVYDIVRWWRLLRTVEGSDWKVDGELTDRELVRLLGVKLLLDGESLPDWEEFKGLSKEEVIEKKEAFGQDRAVIQSVPDWLDEMAYTEIGERWNEEIAALNETANVVLRVNTLKTNKKELQKLLFNRGWDAEETDLSRDALVLKRRGNVFVSPMFKNGLFEVQDAGSQCISAFLKVEPGMRVIDACAGAGGKSLHLATLMQNKGSIISMDTEAWKLTELKRRARRNGIHIIQTRPIDSTKTIKRLHNTADRLLLDVPCSGTGVLRRNPDAKWKLSPGFIENVKATQAEILQRYSAMLRVGGLMVYATCSILPSENERQVAAFLSKNDNFSLLEEKTLTPADAGFDGFYMALLKRHS